MSRNPKSILEEVIRSLEGTDQEHLSKDLRMAWDELPSGTVETEDGEARAYVQVDGEGSAAEALFSLLKHVGSGLAHALQQVDLEKSFPGREAREESIRDLTERLERISDLAAQDHVLFSKKNMPENHVAVSRIINRTPANKKE